MSRSTLNLLLLAGVLITLGLNWLARPQPSQPNREFIPEMFRTARFNAFSPNPNFADGKTLQAPVAGTIPRGLPPLHFNPSPEDAARAGQTLQSPLAPGDPQAAARGAAIFTTFCQPCHGPTGKGDGAVILRGYPAPPPLAADHALQMPDGQMFHVLTYGQKNMPAYAAQISRQDRWNVIAYVRSLQAPPKPAGGQP
jgi:mono/diheme cytochrome c family protein